APLIEGVDLPDGALGEHGVLVERDQLAKRLWRQPLGQDGVGWAVAGEDAVRHQPLGGALSADLVGRLAEGERLALCKDVGHQQVVMLAKWVERSAEADEIAGDDGGALVDELVEGVL